MGGVWLVDQKALVNYFACIKRELYKLVINVLLDCVHSVKQPKRNAGVIMVRTAQSLYVQRWINSSLWNYINYIKK